jgi:hypothetical protein
VEALAYIWLTMKLLPSHLALKSNALLLAYILMLTLVWIRVPSVAVAEESGSNLKMYIEGSFPNGKLYSTPDLEALAGQELSNAWLYGTFKLKSKSGNIWKFTSYRLATGLLFDKKGNEGNTLLIVEYPNGIYPGLDVGQIGEVNKECPFELISVKKSADGGFLVRARSRNAHP